MKWWSFFLILWSVPVIAESPVRSLMTGALAPAEMKMFDNMSREGFATLMGSKNFSGKTNGPAISRINFEAFIRRLNSQAEGVLQATTAAPDGTVTHIGFRLPDLGNAPAQTALKEVKYTDRSGFKAEGFQVSQTYYRGPKVTNGFDVVEVNGVTFRRTLEENDMGQLGGKSARSIFLDWAEKRVQFSGLFSLPPNIEGQVIHFERASNSEVSVYVARASERPGEAEVWEYNFHLNWENAEKKPNLTSPEPKGARQLSKAEIQNLHLIAEKKIIPPRQDVGDGARDIEVERAR